MKFKLLIYKYLILFITVIYEWIIYDFYYFFILILGNY